jgi:hypothetical protein
MRSDERHGHQEGAQPARLGYRAQKFVLRHAMAVGAVTTALGMAGSVIGALQLKLAPRLSIFNTHHTSNTEAYNQYLIGRQLHDRGTVSDRQRAIESYRKAIELDPGYAAAHAALAMSQSALVTYAGTMAQMREAVKEAWSDLCPIR